MKKFAMIGYYHETEGGVYAVGNEGVTIQEAKERAAKEGLALFQLFPLQGKESGDHQFYPRQGDGSYNKQGKTRYLQFQDRGEKQMVLRVPGGADQGGRQRRRKVCPPEDAQRRDPRARGRRAR